MAIFEWFSQSLDFEWFGNFVDVEDAIAKLETGEVVVIIGASGTSVSQEILDDIADYTDLPNLTLLFENALI